MSTDNKSRPEDRRVADRRRSLFRSKMHLLGGCALLLLAAWTYASPLATPEGLAPTKTSPCAEVANRVLEYRKASPSSTAAPVIAAQPAWDCLQSVPVNKTAALHLLRAIRPFLDWQSASNNAASPPAEYAEKVQPAADVVHAIAAIQARLEADQYTKEYDWAFDLYKAFQAVHDGHFYYNPDIVGGVFSWSRPLPLVSVSSDGTKVPAPFVYADIVAAAAGNQSFVPSAVKTINGRDAAEYLVELSQVGSLQDRDALYNTVFRNPAHISLGSGGIGNGVFTGGGRGRIEWPGNKTELEFVNGTTLTINTMARVLVNFTDRATGDILISSAEDLYRRQFAHPEYKVELAKIAPNSTYTPPSRPRDDDPAPATTPTPAPGYPPPVIRQINNIIGGYYIDADGYRDTAVLSVPSFGIGDGGSEKIQNITREFLAASRAANKTKLIIDVSANGGGLILLGYDLFKQLQPQIDAWAASDRIRAFEAVNLAGEVFSDFAGRYERSYNNTDEVLGIVSEIFNYRSDIKAQEAIEHFGSWPERYGPELRQGANFTAKFRWDFNDPLIRNSSGGIDITGYGPLANVSRIPPYPAEDIVVLTDGYCASTCTIFSELARRLAGISYVVVGGRPDTKMTQAVGGIKGTNSVGWEFVQDVVETTWNFSTPAQRAHFPSTELALYDDYLPFYRAAGGAAGVNFRDGIRKTDETELPLQFVYEPADCRIFYTPEMTIDVTALWKKVHDVKWGGAACVAGGFGASAASNAQTPRPALSTTAGVRGVRLSAAAAREVRESFGVTTRERWGRVRDGMMPP